MSDWKQRFYQNITLNLALAIANQCGLSRVAKSEIETASSRGLTPSYVLYEKLQCKIAADDLPLSIHQALVKIDEHAVANTIFVQSVDWRDKFVRSLSHADLLSLVQLLPIKLEGVQCAADLLTALAPNFNGISPAFALFLLQALRNMRRNDLVVQVFPSLCDRHLPAREYLGKSICCTCLIKDGPLIYNMCNTCAAKYIVSVQHYPLQPKYGTPCATCPRSPEQTVSICTDCVRKLPFTCLQGTKCSLLLPLPNDPFLAAKHLFEQARSAIPPPTRLSDEERQRLESEVARWTKYIEDVRKNSAKSSEEKADLIAGTKVKLEKYQAQLKPQKANPRVTLLLGYIAKLDIWKQQFVAIGQPIPSQYSLFASLPLFDAVVHIFRHQHELLMRATVPQLSDRERNDLDLDLADLRKEHAVCTKPNMLRGLQIQIEELEARKKQSGISELDVLLEGWIREIDVDWRNEFEVYE